MSATARYDVYSKYNELEPDNKNIIQAEYIWIGGSGSDLRSKAKTVDLSTFLKGDEKEFTGKLRPDQLGQWNYDGSSTAQALGNQSEVLLNPVKVVPDPFRRGKNILVLCETDLPSLAEMKDPGYRKREYERIKNYRQEAADIFNNAKVMAEKPQFGLEQEYILLERNGRTPLGWPADGYPDPQGQFYCGAGTRNAFGRYIAEAHYKACLFAGLTVSGINGEVFPGQWEFQIGIVEGIDAADQLWLARYLLERVCEDFGVCVSYHPKLFTRGDWNGSGCHTNYSTESTRGEGGWQAIQQAVNKLGALKEHHIPVYGEQNSERMTGLHETAKEDDFKVGVADRGASIRVPNKTWKEKKGYIEDRRPAANIDPYRVTSIIAKSTILDPKDYPTVHIKTPN